MLAWSRRRASEGARLENSMRAMVLETAPGPLIERRVPSPRLSRGHLLIRVRACGVCRTDLHVCDGELLHPKLPLILGHQIVGTVAAIGEGVDGFTEGQRVGVPWLGGACGDCHFCQTERENLCDRAEFTGYQLDGGYAEYTLARPRFALPLPGSFSDLQAAPLLCAGLIGYRALSMTLDAVRLGLYGFGSAAHIVAQVAAFQGRKVFAFTRPGDLRNQEFARKIGAVWAGGSDLAPPETLDAAIIFAPAGALVPRALRAVGKGGSVVCAGIHMSDIPSFPYELLWGERCLRSVANLTRRDGLEFLELAPRIPIHTEVQSYTLADTGRALNDLRSGNVSGALVVTV